ncbi:MAG: hypothetical protein ACXAC5_23555 [Promethearchaeota archaeon]|jgi:hypothetical protein
MLGYLDSIGFYIGFMVFNLVVLILSMLSFAYRKGEGKLLRLKPLIRIFLISALTILLLESIPYLMVNIRMVPMFAVVFDNIFLLLLCYSAVKFELAKLNDGVKGKKKQK